MNVNNKINITNSIKYKIDDAIEYLRNLYNSLKSIKFRNKENIYTKVERSFNDVAVKLHEIPELRPEFRKFLQIKRYVTYIVERNCKDNSFGHIDSIFHLLKLFQDLMNYKLLDITGKINNYKDHFNKFLDELWEFREKFYDEIFDEDFLNDETVKMFNEYVTR